MSISHDDVTRIEADRTSVLGSDGDRIGHVSQVYTSDETGEPVWATVKTGLFGTQETFVPLRGASLDGDDLRVDFDQETVKRAPRVDAGGHLSVEEEDELYRYYGLGTDDQDATPRDRVDTDRDDDRDRRDLTDRDDDRTDRPQPFADRTETDDSSARDSSDDDRDREPVRTTESSESVAPGERTTRLKRYVVTERVVQTVEELPDDDH